MKRKSLESQWKNSLSEDANNAELSDEEIIAMAQGIDLVNDRDDSQEKMIMAKQRLESYGESSLTRGQKVILGLLPPLEYRSELDKRQRSFSSVLQQAQLYLDDLADTRYEETSIKSYGEMCRNSIWDLEKILEEIDENLLKLGAHPPIKRQDAEQYLDQEILRERYYTELITWRAIHKRVRIDIAQVLNKEYSYQSEEEELSTDIMQMICEDLTHLTNEEECRRAAYIVGEIHKRRDSLLKTFMTRPVPTVVPPMVIGIENPLAASLIAAIRYLYEGLSMSWEAANYKIPEQNALNVLRAQYALDRSCVITALADAGVGKQPEDLLKTA